eukprot:gene4196-5302_t
MNFERKIAARDKAIDLLTSKNKRLEEWNLELVEKMPKFGSRGEPFRNSIRSRSLSTMRKLSVSPEEVEAVVNKADDSQDQNVNTSRTLMSSPMEMKHPISLSPPSSPSEQRNVSLVPSSARRSTSANDSSSSPSSVPHLAPTWDQEPTLSGALLGMQEEETTSGGAGAEDSADSVVSSGLLPEVSVRDVQLQRELLELQEQHDNLEAHVLSQTMSRRCLLSKYLKGTAAVYNLSLELPRSMRTGSLDIARCGLEDDDLEMVFEWLQLFSLRDLHTLDLRGSAITFAGIARVLEWLLALPPSDLIRPDLLSIDMSQNKDLE